jgi:hypothetical protein
MEVQAISGTFSVYVPTTTNPCDWWQVIAAFAYQLPVSRLTLCFAVLPKHSNSHRLLAYKISRVLYYKAANLQDANRKQIDAW